MSLCPSTRTVTLSANRAEDGHWLTTAEKLTEEVVCVKPYGHKVAKHAGIMSDLSVIEWTGAPSIDCGPPRLTVVSERPTPPDRPSPTHGVPGG